MGIANAIVATLQAGGKITSQSFADLAMQVWQDEKSARAGGDIETADMLATEFQTLCDWFQREFG